MVKDNWVRGDAYEAYVGRWSRRVADLFLRWLAVPAGRSWLDVGCGTGALSETILSTMDPRSVVGVDPSEGFLATARDRCPAATFRLGTAASLPDGPFDAVVSGLALNFTPDATAAAAEFARVTGPDGLAAVYVWDYAEGMVMMRYFWDAAAALDPAAGELDEGRRFSLCSPESLRALWTDAGFAEVAVEGLSIPTVFAGFDDYWSPFLGGQGSAPSYVATLADDHRDALRDRLRAALPADPDGSIRLTARAWAVRGTRPG
jgi:ubiquinone/menaquinone biosynthesis C-methylase UbiE